MSTVALEAFLPEVLPGVEGVSYPLALGAVRNACMEFCRRTLTWADTMEDAYIHGVGEYDLSGPSGSQVLKALSVVIDGVVPLTPVTLDAVDSWKKDWRTAPGAVTHFVQTSASTLNLIAVPEKDGALVVRVACAPTPKSTQVGAVLFDLYQETIKHGALYRLRSVAGTPWFDPSVAGYHQMEFQRGVSAAIVERNRSNSRASLRVSPVPFV